jgi:hypothetical protein
MSMLNRYMTSNLTWKEIRHCFGDMWNHKIQHHLSVLLSPQYTLNLVCYQFVPSSVSCQTGSIFHKLYINEGFETYLSIPSGSHCGFIYFRKVSFFLDLLKMNKSCNFMVPTKKKRNVVKMIFTFQYFFHKLVTPIKIHL